MSDRARELVKSLGLTKHAEGGFFREVYRSPEVVKASRKDDTRSALTTIYFLLTAGDCSSWHMVASDEAWHYYEGAPLELLVVDPANLDLQHVMLGPVSGVQRPVRVVRAGCWQAARSTGDYTLVGCSVGPGFDYADFRLLRDDSEMTKVFRKTLPEVAELI